MAWAKRQKLRACVKPQAHRGNQAESAVEVLFGTKLNTSMSASA